MMADEPATALDATVQIQVLVLRSGIDEIDPIPGAPHDMRTLLPEAVS